jgi:Sap, sulfolipid-1-addressing protein
MSEEANIAQLILYMAPLAIFWAFSPLTIVIAIMFLSSKGEHGFFNAIAFVLPGVVGSVILGVAMILATSKTSFSRHHTPSYVVYAGQLLIGVVFLGLALHWWRRRAVDGGKMRMPDWARYIDRVKPYQAVGLGLYEFMGDAFFTMAAVADILLAQVGTAQGIVVVVLFILAGTLGLWVPMSIRIFAPRRSQEIFDTTREWLVNNTAVILALEFVSLGLLELTKGLAGILH